MNFWLHRILSNDYGTWGVFGDDVSPLCVTFELPWKNNAPVISCIPEGAYSVIPHNSPDHPGTWGITGVPGRSNILIHNGNLPSDTEGCVLVGSEYSATGVSNSNLALALLQAHVPQSFTLNISNVYNIIAQ